MRATNTAPITSPAASTGQVRDGGHRGASVSAVHTSPTAPSTRTVPTPSMRLPARGSPGPPGAPRQDRYACRQGGEDNGQVDEEDPAPARLDQQAAQHRAAASGDRADRRPRARPRCPADATGTPPGRAPVRSASAPRPRPPAMPGRRSAPADPGPPRTRATRHRTPARPARKHSRRPMLSAARPAGNSSAAKTMAYTSRIHATSGSAAGAKSRCSAGSAMLTTHRSKMIRNWAADTTASTAHRCPPASGCSARRARIVITGTSRHRARQWPVSSPGAVATPPVAAISSLPVWFGNRARSGAGRNPCRSRSGLAGVSAAAAGGNGP